MEQTEKAPTIFGAEVPLAPGESICLFVFSRALMLAKTVQSLRRSFASQGSRLLNSRWSIFQKFRRFADASCCCVGSCGIDCHSTR